MYTIWIDDGSGQTAVTLRSGQTTATVKTQKVTSPPASEMAPLGALKAEKTPSIKAGDRVLIKAPSIREALTGTPWIRGFLVSLDADTLVLKENTRTTLAIPLDSVTRFRVSRGRRSHALRGAGVRAGIEVLVGGVLSATTWEEPELFQFQGTRRQSIMLGAVLLGVPFAVLGAAIGAASHSEQWEEVSLPLHVGLSPHGGVRVALRFEFRR